MLQGSLDNFTLDEVLSLLATTSKTGCLAISGDRGAGSLWLDDGSVVGADASNLEDRTATNDVMFELLRFETGSFLFTMNERLDAPGVAEDVDTLLDGAQERITEWRTIESVVPSLDHELWLTRSLTDDEVRLSRSDWDVVVAVGEGNTVGAVCTEVNLSEVDGSREIKGLIERGVLTISELPATASAPAFEAPVVEAPVFEAPVAEAATAGFIDAGDVAGFAAPVEPAPDTEPSPDTEFAFLDAQAAEEFASEPVAAFDDPGAPAASFGATLASETLNTPVSSPDPADGLHELFSVADDPAPVFEAAAPDFEPAAFEPAAFEAPQPVDTPAAFAPDAGRPPMPPPPTIGSDGSIQPPASLAGLVEEDDDEASLLMRYLKTDSH